MPKPSRRSGCRSSRCRQENVEGVRLAYEAWNRDLDAVLLLIHPDAGVP